MLSLSLSRLALVGVVATACGVFDFGAPTRRHDGGSGGEAGDEPTGGSNTTGGAIGDGGAGDASGTGGSGANSRGGSAAGGTAGNGGAICTELDAGWSDAFGPDGYDFGKAVAVDANDDVVLVANIGGADVAGDVSSAIARITKYSASGDFVWDTFIGNGSDDCSVDSLAIDRDGFIYASGWFEGSLVIDRLPALVAQGATSPLLVKLDSNGRVLWAKSPEQDTPFENHVSVTSVAVDGDGNLVVGTAGFGSVDYGEGPGCSPMMGPLGLAKLDGDGNCIWFKNWDLTPGYLGLGLAVDRSSGAVALGVSALYGVDFGRGTALPSTGDADAFVVKFDADGTTAWARAFGNDAEHVETSQDVRALAFTPSGSVIATGLFVGQIDFGDGAFGTAAPSSSGGGWIARLDGATGSVEAHQTFVDAGEQSGEALSFGSDGTVALAGVIVEDERATGLDFAGTIVPAPHDNVMGRGGVFIATLNDDLTPCFIERWGSDQDARATGVAVHSNGALSVAATFYGLLRIGDASYASSYSDALVATFVPR